MEVENMEDCINLEELSLANNQVRHTTHDGGHSRIVTHQVLLRQRIVTDLTALGSSELNQASQARSLMQLHQPNR